MAQKLKIEYVGDYYSYGSEARKVKVNPVILSTARTQKRTVIIDPVALAGIVLAVVLFVGLAIGSVQFFRIRQTNEALHNTVQELRLKNAGLHSTYEQGFDRDEIRVQAKSLGMIPVEEAPIRFMTVHMPAEQAAGSTWLSDLRWFLTGLFER